MRPRWVPLALALAAGLAVGLPAAALAEHDHATTSPGEHVHDQDAVPSSPSSRGAVPSEDPGPVSPPGELAARLAAAGPGEVVNVSPGTYLGNLVVDIPITLRGVGRPALVGDGTGTVLTIRAPGTVVTGFSVRGSGIGPVGSPSGIRIEADDVRVRDVVVEDVYTGIHVAGAADVDLVGNSIRGRAGATVTGETHALEASEDEPEHQGQHAAPTSDVAAERGDAISLWDTERVLVRRNVIADARDGVFLTYSTDVLVDRNRIEDSRYAVHSMFASELVLSENLMRGNLSGAVMMYGGPALLLRNTVRDSRSSSTGFGILLKDVDDARTVENVLVGNRVGLQVDGPPAAEHTTMVALNTIALNRIGVSLYPSARATFTGNSFVENLTQVLGQGRGVGEQNAWSHEGAGNYWSGYRGYDVAGDGIGDVAHAEGGMIEDAVARAPVLAALASGPAFELLRAVEDRWVERQPVARDPQPLVEPHSPALAAGPRGGSRGILAVAGALLVGLALVVVGRFRRPRIQEVRGAEA